MNHICSIFLKVSLGGGKTVIFNPSVQRVEQIYTCMLDLETLKDQTPALTLRLIDFPAAYGNSTLWKTKTKKTKKNKKENNCSTSKTQKSKQSKQASIPQNLLVAVHQKYILIGQQRKVASLFQAEIKKI